MKKLTDYFPKEEFTRFVEEYLYDENTLIEQGYYLEIYTNYNSKYVEESSYGTSSFVYIDMDISYGDLLKYIESGSYKVKYDNLAISILGVDEEQEREFCLENPISPKILPLILTSTFN